MTAKPLIDHRIYTIKPRRMAQFLDVFDRLAMPVEIRHFGPPIGFYVSDTGMLNQVVHLWAFESLADLEARRDRRDQDPEWPAYIKASVDLIDAQENRFIRAVPLKSLEGL